jgi:hypothetical protein
MKRFASKPGFAALAAGIVILLHLLAIPMVLRADREFVYFGSTALPEMCSLRKVYGVPCPTCGMTRGLVLSLHGQVQDAIETNAAAPALAALSLVLGMFLTSSGGLRLAGRERWAARLSRWIRYAGIGGGAGWALVLALNWAAALRHLRL